MNNSFSIQNSFLSPEQKNAQSQAYYGEFFVLPWFDDWWQQNMYHKLLSYIQWIDDSDLNIRVFSNIISVEWSIHIILEIPNLDTDISDKVLDITTTLQRSYYMTPVTQNLHYSIDVNETTLPVVIQNSYTDDSQYHRLQIQSQMAHFFVNQNQLAQLDHVLVCTSQADDSSMQAMHDSFSQLKVTLTNQNNKILDQIQEYMAQVYLERATHIPSTSPKIALSQPQADAVIDLWWNKSVEQSGRVIEWMDRFEGMLSHLESVSDSSIVANQVHMEQITQENKLRWDESRKEIEAIKNQLYDFKSSLFSALEQISWKEVIVDSYSPVSVIEQDEDDMVLKWVNMVNKKEFLEIHGVMHGFSVPDLNIVKNMKNYHAEDGLLHVFWCKDEHDIWYIYYLKDGSYKRLILSWVKNICDFKELKFSDNNEILSGLYQDEYWNWNLFYQDWDSYVPMEPQWLDTSYSVNKISKHCHTNQPSVLYIDYWDGQEGIVHLQGGVYKKLEIVGISEISSISVDRYNGRIILSWSFTSWAQQNKFFLENWVYKTIEVKWVDNVSRIESLRHDNGRIIWGRYFQTVQKWKKTVEISNLFFEQGWAFVPLEIQWESWVIEYVNIDEQSPDGVILSWKYDKIIDIDGRAQKIISYFYLDDDIYRALHIQWVDLIKDVVDVNYDENNQIISGIYRSKNQRWSTVDNAFYLKDGLYYPLAFEWVEYISGVYDMRVDGKWVIQSWLYHVIQRGEHVKSNMFYLQDGEYKNLYFNENEHICEVKDLQCYDWEIIGGYCRIIFIEWENWWPTWYPFYKQDWVFKRLEIEWAERYKNADLFYMKRSKDGEILSGEYTYTPIWHNTYTSVFYKENGIHKALEIEWIDYICDVRSINYDEHWVPQSWVYTDHVKGLDYWNKKRNLFYRSWDVYRPLQISGLDKVYNTDTVSYAWLNPLNICGGQVPKIDDQQSELFIYENGSFKVLKIKWVSYIVGISSISYDENDRPLYGKYVRIEHSDKAHKRKDIEGNSIRWSEVNAIFYNDKWTYRALKVKGIWHITNISDVIIQDGELVWGKTRHDDKEYSFVKSMFGFRKTSYEEK